MKTIFVAIFCVLLMACSKSSNVVEYAKLKQTVGMTKAQVKEALGPPDDVTSETLWWYSVVHPDSGKQAQCQMQFYGPTPDVVTEIYC